MGSRSRRSTTGPRPTNDSGHTSWTASSNGPNARRQTGRRTPQPRSPDMATEVAERELTTIDLVKETLIEAPVEIVFQSMLEEMGPGSQLPDGSPFPMKIEPWPGGRWFRDLGNNT